eukprot:TRINITY_DN7543_c0_g1_i4.p1 TRINITY_DN7543_c0_g1~~TRINITY_DN7543_c0_g1_i4.p1  ORF type:complete len:155 (-),score=21.16 TRINITY_DN7543_c0_g1_i4:43-507(-)
MNFIKGKELGGMGETPKAVQAFLEQIVKEESPVVQVLKACNQSIIAPFVMELRLNLCKDVPFKDGGGWRISVQILEDQVCILHNKRQKQLRTDGQPEVFEFEWELKMTFPLNMREMTNISFKVTSIDYTVDAEQEVKDKLNQTLEPYFQHVNQN